MNIQTLSETIASLPKDWCPDCQQMSNLLWHYARKVVVTANGSVYHRDVRRYTCLTCILKGMEKTRKRGFRETGIKMPNKDKWNVVVRPINRELEDDEFNEDSGELHFQLM